MRKESARELVAHLIKVTIILVGATSCLNMALDMPLGNVIALACGIALAADAFRE